MSAQLTHEGTRPRYGMSTTRAALRTRPRVQRILIRSLEYIPAVRAAILILRLLAVGVLAVFGIALLSASNWWGLASLALGFAVVLLALWVFTTAAKGWPAR
jgi:hypothetical protein